MCRVVVCCDMQSICVSVLLSFCVSVVFAYWFTYVFLYVVCVRLRFSGPSCIDCGIAVLLCCVTVWLYVIGLLLCCVPLLCSINVLVGVRCFIDALCYWCCCCSVSFNLS